MTTTTDTATGRVLRVDGPLVEATGLGDVATADLVVLGRDRLPGEVAAVRGDIATVQVYDYTGGLAPGDPVVCLGQPLSVELGPGLLGGVFDGLLRPLHTAGTWLTPGAVGSADTDARWAFTPAVTAGTIVAAGQRVGTVAVAGTLTHHVIAPPDVGGTVDWIATAGSYAASDAVARIAGRDVAVSQRWPVRRARPCRQRLDATEPLVTGQRVLDVLFPVARGSSAAVPGGFGTGKTVLLQQVAKWCDADVIVYVGCGERGNEMADVLTEFAALEDPRNGGRLAERTVIIANTSNMAMMARETSIYTGVTVAEYYRDMGYDTVVIADSTSRWAEALREFASRSGALPAEEGYPAALSSALAAFYERAGKVRTLSGETGSVTILGAVSPAGGDLTEPVTVNTERFVRCLWTLDRDLAYARHYPAVSWAGSFSRDDDALAAWYAANGDPGWGRRRASMITVLAEADRLAAVADLIGADALPDPERLTLLGGRLLREAVLQQSALNPNDSFCSATKAAAVIDNVLTAIDACSELLATGVTAATIERQDFTDMLRAAADAGPDDADAVRQRGAALLARLEGLS